MDTAALDALWDGLDRVGTHFWKAEASAVTWNQGGSLVGRTPAPLVEVLGGG